MSKKQKFTVDDAYAVKTTADIVRLYDDWADTYDSDIFEIAGFVGHLRVAERLVRQRTLINGAVLDVGCGTGAVGVSLREAGIDVVDGIDISPRMLARAGEKKTNGGDPIYRRLIAADLTQKLDIPDNQYAGLVSAGTFTHAHLGPDPLDELWRVAAPGARCAIAVRSTHYAAEGFGEKLAVDVGEGRITEPEIMQEKMYSAKTNHPERADDTILIVVCQVL